MTAAPRYGRNPSVTETEVDGELFLVEPVTQEVFYLDRIGAALWRLLAEPQSPDELVSVYCAAFPDTDAATIRRDLDDAIRELIGRGLVQALS